MPSLSSHIRYGCCRALRLLALCTAVALLVPAQPALAQFRLGDDADQRVQSGERIQLFARWGGRTSLDGIIVELPLGWHLHQARFIREEGSGATWSVMPVEQGTNTYVVQAPQRIQQAGTVALQVEVGGVPGTVVWAMTPFVYRAQENRRTRQEPFRVARRMVQVDAMPVSDNHALRFRDGDDALLLRREALPPLDVETAHTVEFWIKTLGLSEVVLSTWTGDEQEAYPLELVVGADGRLFYYRGQPGQHLAMQTPHAVADGRWHHVAVSHDPDVGWTRLLMDGTPVDSLYRPFPQAPAWRGLLALGGRAGTQDPGGLRSFTGLLDEVRLWPSARTPSAIRRAMRQPLSSRPDVVVLRFEEDVPEALVAQAPARVERIQTDLAFHHPVSDLQAVPEGEGITVTWTSRDPSTETFIVERSHDGVRFEVVGRIDAGTDPASREVSPSYEFRDDAVTEQVVYYRIRQHFTSGGERLSGTIKLGLGLKQTDALLIGNYPNPFTRATSIGYEVKEAQDVHLSVWDLSGQHITTLVDRMQQPGYYEARFASSDLPSGTYFVRLRTSQGIQSHKMTLAK